MKNLIKAVTNYFSGQSIPTAGPDNFPTVYAMQSAVRLLGSGNGMTIPTYFACVRNLSEDVAKLPVHVRKKRRDGGREYMPNSKVAALLDRPNPHMDGFTFRSTMTAWALTDGNAIALIQRDEFERPIALWPVHPSRTQYGSDPNTMEVYITIRLEGKEPFIVSADDVVYLHGLGDGPVGYSVAEYARKTIYAASGSQDFLDNFLRNGAAPGGTVTVPHKLSQEAYNRLRDSWESRHQGAHNVNKVAILEEGAKYETVPLKLSELQFLESRKFSTTDICRWFRMPPHKVQDLEKASYNTVEQLDIEYVRDTLTPWILRWENELTYKIAYEPMSYVKLDLKGVVRGDMASRGAFYKTLFSMGALSPNDIRELEDMDPVEGGDQYFIEGNNMVPLDSVEDAAERDMMVDDAVDSTMENLDRKEEKAMAKLLEAGDSEKVAAFQKRHAEQVAAAVAPIIALYSDREKQARALGIAALQKQTREEIKRRGRL